MGGMASMWNKWNKVIMSSVDGVVFQPMTSTDVVM